MWKSELAGLLAFLLNAKSVRCNVGASAAPKVGIP